MTSQDSPEQRLGRLVRERRRDLGWSQNELAVKAGVSDATISKIETGRGATTQPRKVRDLEAALGWAPGSFRAVRNGGEPIMDDDQQDKSRHRPLPGSNSEPPDTIAPSYEVLPGIWYTTNDPLFAKLTAAEQLAFLRSKIIDARGSDEP